MTDALVVIGASLGGTQALQTILAALPLEFPFPIAIVLHRGVGVDTLLQRTLQHKSRLPITEAEDKMAILPGVAYLAPANYHLLVERDHFSLSTEGPVRFARPSIDLLFQSAAEAYAKRTIGILLTGASQDGAQGLAAIKRYGGLVVVQDPATAASPVMPTAALQATPVDAILPLEGIGPFLVQCGQQRDL